MNGSLAALLHIQGRFFQTFSLLVWITNARRTGGASGAHDVLLRNAAIESSLMTLREIDAFFLSGKSYPTDMRAVDFAFTVGKPFLSKDERDSINRILAHLTYHAVEPGRGKHHWNVADLTRKMWSVFLPFLLHLEHNHFNGNSVAQQEVRDFRTVAQKLMTESDRLAKNEEMIITD